MDWFIASALVIPVTTRFPKIEMDYPRTPDADDTR